MKIIDRYLGRSFLRSWLSVNLVLAGLFSFLEFVKQLDHVGKGRYVLTDALLYVGLTLPGRMLDLTPTSALLGSIAALALLAKNLELIALRANGIPIQRVGLAFARPAVLTLLALLLAAQFIIPSLEQTAWTLRETALADSGTILPRGDFWTRDEKRFVNLHTARENGIQAVEIYELDDNGRLVGYIHAEETHIGAGGNWELRGVEQKVITERGGTTREMEQLVLSDLLTREQAAVLALPAQTLSLSELYSIITNLQKREQNAGRYRLALWQKLNLPVMAAALIMLSLPFVGGPVRKASFGWRIMVGAILGVVFFFSNQILGYTGLILQISPFWTTLLPALAVLVGGAFLTRRID
jgi:lipopolysaccharide export system permease protein